MDKNQTFRWGVLLSALGLTIGAIFYPTEEPLSAEAVLPPVRTNPSVPKAPVQKVTQGADASPQWVASDEDPFAPRAWVAPPPSAAPAPSQPAVLADAPPPPPPPLPYKVVGQMSDGADRLVYLKSGEQVLLARAGEVVEGAYRVLAVTATQIEFESVGSGIHQALPLVSQDN